MSEGWWYDEPCLVCPVCENNIGVCDYGEDVEAFCGCEDGCIYITKTHYLTPEEQTSYRPSNESNMKVFRIAEEILISYNKSVDK